MNKKIELALQLLIGGIVSFILLYFFSGLILAFIKYSFYFISIILIVSGIVTFYEFIKEKIHDKKNR